MRLVALVLLAAADGAKRLPQSWLVSETFDGGVCMGPLSQWSAKSFGLCQYEASLFNVLLLDRVSNNITTTSYGPTDSTCNTPLGTSESVVPPDALGCQTQFYSGTKVATQVYSLAGAYSAVSPFGLPRAPFVGTGYFTTLSSDCSDVSQVTEISLSASSACLDPGASVADGGDGVSFSISCADINNPVPLEYAGLNCAGPAKPMTASNPRFADITQTIKAAPCTLRDSSKQYLKQVFCVDTAVATRDRFFFPSPSPTPKPHPSAPPTRAPTAKPTPTPGPTATYLAADTLALCSLANTFTGPDRAAKLASWCQPGQMACDATLPAPYTSWAGVTCAVVHDCSVASCGLDNKLRVTAVGLLNMQLGGNVPPAVGGLDALTSLKLDGLGLSGGLPTELGLLKEARTLVLARNEFVGNIPPQLSLLKSLQTLSLGHNSLSGTLPSQLGGLSSLTGLDISANLLSGGLPSQLGLLGFLRTLDVGSNSLSSAVPGTLCSLADKSCAITLTGNKFSCLPQCLSSFPAVSRDANLALCAIPSPRPTEAPTVTRTPPPSSPSSLLPPAGKQPLSEQKVVDNVDSTIGTGGIVGITLGFAALFFVGYLVYRLVKYSEELPLYDDAVDVQSNPLSVLSAPQQQQPQHQDMGGRRDSIPLAQGPSPAPTQTLRRDTIPGVMNNVAPAPAPRRIDPFARNQDL